MSAVASLPGGVSASKARTRLAASGIMCAPAHSCCTLHVCLRGVVCKALVLTVGALQGMNGCAAYADPDARLSIAVLKNVCKSLALVKLNILYTGVIYFV